MFDSLLNLSNKKILIIGDSMLDCYVNIIPRKISSEYPGLIYNFNDDNYCLGGAANVANILSKNNIKVHLFSIVGNDNYKDIFLKLLEKENINSEIMIESDYETIVKTRLVSDFKQVIRIDKEKTFIKNKKNIIEKLNKLDFKTFDLVLISDYRKGLITQETFDLIVNKAKKDKIKVICDPKDNQVNYHDLYVLKPNKNEIELLISLDDKQIFNYMKKNKIENVLLTLGSDGIKLYEENTFKTFPVVKTNVCDVTGAGDIVLSFIALGILSNLGFENISILSNLAASFKVEQFGTKVVTLSDIFNKINGKVINIKNLETFSKILHTDNKKIVFTNGCFDIIHSGHIHILNKSKNMGDILILGLNSDASIKRLKGNDRPIYKEKDRIKILEAIEYIDYIVVFDEDTPLNIIKTIKPHILVKGADYKDKYIAGKEEVLQYGGTVELIDLIDGNSTTSLIDKIKGDKND